jgi:uncharacterized membrane protein
MDGLDCFGYLTMEVCLSMIPLEMGTRMMMDLMAYSIIALAMLCLLFIALSVHWMRQCKDAEDYADDLLQRLRPYEQPGRGTVVIPDYEIYNDRTNRWEPLRAPQVQDRGG